MWHERTVRQHRKLATPFGVTSPGKTGAYVRSQRRGRQRRQITYQANPFAQISLLASTHAIHPLLSSVTRPAMAPK